MQNFMLQLQFDGRNFHGWQIQQNSETIQGALQAALRRITNVEIPVIGCSRTDAGVHAQQYTCNFFSKKDLLPERFVAALNFYLPRQIVVLNCKIVEKEFHSRYDCKRKMYCYQVFNHPVRNPFWEDRALWIKNTIDPFFLQNQANSFLGTHDFSSFCGANTTVQSKIRTVSSIFIQKKEETVLFFVEADGFLYHMVRIMIGTLLEISNKKISADSIPSILREKNREKAGVTAPAHGLYLWKTTY